MKEAKINDQFPLYPAAGQVKRNIIITESQFKDQLLERPIADGCTNHLNIPGLRLNKSVRLTNSNDSLTNFKPANDLKRNILSDPNPFKENFILNRQESIYRTNRLYPLGSVPKLDSSISDKFSKAEIQFGKPNPKNLYSINEVIHSGIGLKENSKNLDNYRRTHKSTLPGEQLRRNYNWPFDPREHVFAVETKVREADFKECFTQANKPSTVNKNLEDFKRLNFNQIMRSKTNFEVFNTRMKNFANGNLDRENIGDCFKYSDLENTSKNGLVKNKTARELNGMVFGLPTTVLSKKNYNIKTVKEELDLCLPLEENIYEKEEVLISFAELKELFSKPGRKIEELSPESVWLKACEFEGLSQNDPSTRVLLKTVLNTIKKIY